MKLTASFVPTTVGLSSRADADISKGPKRWYVSPVISYRSVGVAPSSVTATAGRLSKLCPSLPKERQQK